MKTRKTLTVIAVISLILAGYYCSAQTAEELLPKAIQLEEVKGELDEAIKIYQLILDQYPDNRKVCAEALLHIGICYEKLGSEQARQAYQDVVNKYSEQEQKVALARERITRLEAYTAELTRQAEQHMKKGNELFKLWEYESAIKEYESAISFRPNTLLALNAQYCIGQSLYRAGKYDAALATFTKLIKENPKSNIAPVTELMVAQVKYAMGNDNSQGLAKNKPSDNMIVDPETGITFTKVKSLTGKSDIITWPNFINLSPNGKFLLFENMVVPMDGTSPFELIDFKSTGIQATRGTWSPDGTKAAFYSGDALCVVPVSPETGHAIDPFKKIIKAELKWQFNPGWSPDGKRITYHGPEGDIWIINADGTELQQISISDMRASHPIWSSDGKIIIYNKGRRLIGLYSLENGISNEFFYEGMLGNPVWKQDEKLLLGDWGKMYFYDLKDMSNPQFVFSIPKEVGAFFSLSQDGKKMLFLHSSYFANTGLKIASPEGGPSFEPVPLLTNWGTARWSTDSKLIAVQGEDENGEIAIRILPLEGGKSYLINLDNLTERKPFPFSVSSNLNKIIFIVDRDDGKEDLYAVPISAKEARITGPAVKIFDGWYREGTYNIRISLSPNGEKVALRHEEDIWIAFTNGDSPIKIAEKGSYLRWTDNGEALLLNTAGWSLLVNPGPQGRIIELLDGDKKVECRWANIDVSPDNSQFAVLSDNQIKIIPLDKGKKSQILDISKLELTQCNYIQWSPDGKNLAFIGMKETDDPLAFPDGKYYIYNYPIDGSKPVRVAPDDYHTKYELSWSPDGKWIAYSVDKSVKVRPESTIWEADFDKIVEKLGK